MKATWETISSGLDQLWFTPFVEDETPQDRADATENFLKSNGWTWDEVLNEISKDPINGPTPVCH